MNYLPRVLLALPALLQWFSAETSFIVKQKQSLRYCPTLNICLALPDASNPAIIEDGYRFWGPKKKHRIAAGLRPELLNETMQAFDCVDFMYQRLQINRAVATDDANLTRAFCSRLPVIVSVTFSIAAVSISHGAEYNDPFTLQNYLFYYVMFSSSTTVAFKLRTQVAADLGLSFREKLIGLLLLPLVLVVLVFDVTVLRRMSTENDSSAFTIHMYICRLDFLLYVCLLYLGFPLGFLLAQGAPCIAMNGELMNVAGHPWTMDVAYRCEESITCLKNILLSMLMADRTMSAVAPRPYFRFFHATLARNLFLIAVAANTVVLALMFANAWYLSWIFDQKMTFRIFIVARGCLLIFLVMVICSQAVLPVIFIRKLIQNFYKMQEVKGAKKTYNRLVFLVVFTVYNLCAAVSLYAFLIGDTLFQLLIMGQCNRCLYWYETLGMFCKFVECVISFVQGTGSITGFLLHIAFIASYRRECIKLLRLHKVIRQLQRCCNGNRAAELQAPLRSRKSTAIWRLGQPNTARSKGVVGERWKKLRCMVQRKNTLASGQPNDQRMFFYLQQLTFAFDGRRQTVINESRAPIDPFPTVNVTKPRLNFVM